MKKLSEATTADFTILSDLLKKPDRENSVQELAQQFVDTIFERFQGSMVLLRLFSSLP